MDLTPYDDPQDAVGVAFRLARRRHRMSQRDLADALGWDAAKVGRWESGHVAPALARVDDVLRGMGFRLAVVACDPQEWADLEEPHEHAVNRGFRRLPAHLDQDVLEVRHRKWWARHRHDPNAMAPVWTYRRREGLSGTLADLLPGGAGAAAAGEDEPAETGEAPGRV